MDQLSMPTNTKSMRMEAFVREFPKPRYSPHAPTERQAALLAYQGIEALYGGAAGGGKSDYLLMAAMQYVHVPNYAALLLRRTYADLSLPGALMDRCGEWLQPTDAKYRASDKKWIFPSGATLSFGHLDNENQKYRYQGAEFQFIGFDELTQFTETQYRYLFSRLRRLKDGDVPLRMRAASNPGGIGHDWVYQRFFVERGRVFISAMLEDNPFLDQEEYEASLNELDPITRRQLRHGDWHIRPEGGMFKREWFDIVDHAPANNQKVVRYWDLAASVVEKGKKQTDPDYSVGCKMSLVDGVYYIEDVKRFRARPDQVERWVHQTAQLDGKAVSIFMEQEPGSSGKIVIDQFARRVLVGYPLRGDRVSGSKVERARGLSAAAEQGNVKLVRGPWNREFLDEIAAFPEVAHDDQVDGASGAFNKLSGKRPTRSREILW